MENLVLKEGPPDSVGMDPLRVKGLRELCAGWVKSGDTPSLVVLVARRGTIVLHEAFGARRPEDTTATLRPDAIFPIASCTKPLTAAAVMCLVEDGLIGLNRPFIEYVPELDVPGVQWLEEARVADLLCHTSGIDDMQWGAFVSTAAQKSNQMPPQISPTSPGQHPMARRLALAAGAPLHYRPGTAMVYSNFGFNLLGEIVRRVSGRPLWQFALLRLFEPLGMHDTSWILPAELRGRRVYRGPGMPWIPPVPGLHGGGDSAEYDEIDFGCGGVTSTARNLAIFLQMLLNRGTYNGRRILSPATVAAMTRPQVDSAIPKILVWADATGKRIEAVSNSGDYGYGLFVQGKGDTYRMNGALGSPSSFGHAGYGGPYIWADPERDLLIAFLTVAPRMQREYAMADFDLFQNAVYGALVN